MSFVVIPDYISDAIDVMVDKALLDYPAAEPDRHYLRGVLVAYVDEHGRLPESFRLEPPK